MPVAELISSFPALKPFLVGAFSGTCSTILFQPLDLVKTRIQATLQPCSVGTITVMGNVLRQEKLVGLWKGLTPSMMRCVPGVGLYFGTLHWLTSNFVTGEPTAVEAICLGLTARCISGATLLPVTVVKTRFESGVYQYATVIDALQKIYKIEGARGLYSGLTATLIRDAPFSGIYLMFYTQMKKHCPTGWKEGQFSSLILFSCGVVSGCLASLLTQPADVIKTQVQLFPECYGKTSVAVLQVYKVHGLNGYFRGLAPRLLRRTLMSAMSWTIYEHVIKTMGI